VRRSVVQTGIPRILNVTGDRAAGVGHGGGRALGIRVLGVRTHIEGLRIRIAEVYLESMRHRAPQNELACVVGADPERRPREQRGELRIPEGYRRQPRAYG